MENISRIDKTIIDSDEFLDMPLTAQALYFHLAMNADDYGFINNARAIQRAIDATIEDLLLLINKGFLVVIHDDEYEIAITHWCEEMEGDEDGRC